MNSTCEPDFWERYNALPNDIREIAEKAYALWRLDPSYPSLHFKHLQGTEDWWSVRIGRRYRAVCTRRGENVTWFFIGSHTEYDQLLR